MRMEGKVVGRTAQQRVVGGDGGRDGGGGDAVLTQQIEKAPSMTSYQKNRWTSTVPNRK